MIHNNKQIKKITLKKLNTFKPRYISKGFNVPKWIIFCETLIIDDWEVRVYASKSTVSKYVYIKKGCKNYKVRFSNHKASIGKEDNDDSDFYIGIGNKYTLTTEKLLGKLIKNKTNNINEEKKMKTKKCLNCGEKLDVRTGAYISSPLPVHIPPCPKDKKKQKPE